ncbi:MAG: limonene-1,2-epoxide hydrolase [Alphaproteobacteria bacterium]|nr:limonene-1,2-epoxide hydrolase [Alphaproteobacteria bacterium]
MSRNVDLVLAFIAAWERRDLDAILAAVTEDVVYHNIPMQPVTGRDAMRQALAPFLTPATAVRWAVRAIAEAADGAVLTERLDEFEFGPKRLAIPVMGIFELRDGLIAQWRDYFDLADFQRQMA